MCETPGKLDGILNSSLFNDHSMLILDIAFQCESTIRKLYCQRFGDSWFFHLQGEIEWHTL
jgi:hypothetical protein